jgi:hypothetical protein
MAQMNRNEMLARIPEGTDISQMSDRQIAGYLTPEQLALFDMFDYGAFDLYKASNPNVQQAAWLCMSDEARQEVRQAALNAINVGLQENLTMDEARKLINKSASQSLRNMMNLWREHERDLQVERNLNMNPAAWHYPAHNSRDTA